MPDTKVTCSKRIYGSRVYSNTRCSRTAVVTRNGTPYCRQHDPERIKEREEAQAKADALVCHYIPSGSLSRKNRCGKPAVTEDKWGYPLCALHTEEALEANKQLREQTGMMTNLKDSLRDSLALAQVMPDDPLAALVVERLSAGISIVNTRTADHRRCVGTGGCEFTAFGHPSCEGTGRVPIDLSGLTPEAQADAIEGIVGGIVDEIPKSWTAYIYAEKANCLLPKDSCALAALTAVLKERQEASHE